MEDTEMAEAAVAQDVVAPTEGPAEVITSTTTSPPATDENAQRAPITVTKPTPYTFDLGNLLCNDANPLSPTSASTLDSTLQSTARDCAQSLINQLLTTCPISSTANGVLLTLPAPSTPLPREKPVPVEKPPTKWEQFAAKKGIQSKKRGEGKTVYHEAKGEWVPKWGYKGKNKDGEGDWLMEVDEKKERAAAEAGGELRGQNKRERMEKARRNERAMRANERKGRKKSG